MKAGGKRDTVLCSECGRYTPETRGACLYCGAPLPVAFRGSLKAQRGSGSADPEVIAEDRGDGSPPPDQGAGLPQSVEDLFAQLRLEGTRRRYRMSRLTLVLVFFAACALGGIIVWFLR